MPNSLVSVVIPTWNRSQTLPKTIKSVLDQTYHNIEIIVVDDGSQDKTETIVGDMTKRDSRIKYYYHSHTGNPAATRNLGIKKSRGDYVAFLDSDDCWLPSKIITQMDYLVHRNSVFCASNAYAKNRRHIFTKMPFVAGYEEMQKTNWVICSSVIVSKKILVDVGFFPEKKEYISYEDWVLWMRIASVYDLNFVSKPLLIYSENSIDSVRNHQVDWNKINSKLRRDVVFWGIRNILSQKNKRRLLKSIKYSLFTT